MNMRIHAHRMQKVKKKCKSEGSGTARFWSKFRQIQRAPLLTPLLRIETP